MVSLNALEAGITRLRAKGGANPKALYDLVNGYVAQDGSIQSRPGTSDEILLPAGTKGFCAVNGGLVVFANEAKTITDARVTCEVITHPTDPTLELIDIHFAGPFLGGASGAYLYVVAEFADSSVFHYWLQQADTWQASTSYNIGDLVQPTVPNGYLYRAARLDSPKPVWAPGVLRTVGDIIEATTFNGFEYTCVETIGDNPRSGTIEPVWPTEDGAQVIEDTNGVATVTTTPGTYTPPPATPPTGIIDRYGTGGGTGAIQ